MIVVTPVRLNPIERYRCGTRSAAQYVRLLRIWKDIDSMSNTNIDYIDKKGDSLFILHGFMLFVGMYLH